MFDATILADNSDYWLTGYLDSSLCHLLPFV